MKKNALLKLALLAIFGAAALLPAQSGITFTLDGKTPPAISGTVRTLEPVGLTVSGYNLTAVRFSGDSLVLCGLPSAIDTGIDPIPGPLPMDLIARPYFFWDTTAVFETAMIYQAYLDNNWCGTPPRAPLIPLGAVAVRPGLKTRPLYPLAGQPFGLQLIAGGTHSYCPPSLYDSAAVRVSGQKLYLNWRERQSDRACILIYLAEPQPYGPVFTVPSLSAGTYEIMVPGDTLPVAMVTVSNPVRVLGSAFVMQHPYVRMMTRPVPGAQVLAITDNGCDFNLYGIPSKPDTLKTVTDSAGSFVLDLPDDGRDFRIEVLARGFHPQAQFLSALPQNRCGPTERCYPPSRTARYELLGIEQPLNDSLAVQVTNGKTPVESVYISLSPGRPSSVCPVYETLDASAPIGYFPSGQYTDRRGSALFSRLSLAPFIDYYWTAWHPRLSAPLTGIVRLNRYYPDSLKIDLSVTACESPALAPTAGCLTAQPNPFNASVRIALRNPGKEARVSILNIAGRTVADFGKVRTSELTWNASRMPAGLYLVRMATGSRVETLKLIFQK